MDLENVSAVIRPRTPWEAIDLGLKLARESYGQLLLASLVVTLPLLVVLNVLLVQHLWLAGLMFWWLKPLWERTHLFILSRRLFGSNPSADETLRAFRSYGFRDALPWLSYRRLSITRSFDLPITQLEAMRGEPRRGRLAVLHQGRSITGATWLTIVFANFEGLFGIGIALLIQSLIPSSSDASFLDWLISTEEAGIGGLLAMNLISAGTAILIAPFYVAAGFSLYINRRTVLEGWDLEIAFRRLARRLEARPRSTALVAGIVLCLAAGCVFATASIVHPAVAHASTSATPLDADADADAARARIQEVLKSEPFHEPVTRTVPEFDWGDEQTSNSAWIDWLLDWLLQEPDEPSAPPEFPAWLQVLLNVLPGLIARVGEISLIVAAIAIVVIVIHRYRGNLLGLVDELRPSRRQRVTPTVLMGLDVSPESLPADVSASARALWQSGAAREALGLLYRASLVELMSRHGARFGTGDTERDCLDTARSTPGVPEACASYLAELSRHWQRIAYGHRPPEEAVAEDLLDRWPRHFEAQECGEPHAS